MLDIGQPSRPAVVASDRADAFARSEKATATIRAYRSDAAMFDAWAAASGIPSCAGASFL